MAVVYRHRRNDTDKVFYVGYGCKESRAYETQEGRRSSWWKRIYNKHGVSIEVVAKDLSKENALELEELMIASYGRIDLKEGQLINMTDGGESGNRVIVTAETRAKISKAHKGRVHTSEARKNMGKNWLGKKAHNRLKIEQYDLQGNYIQTFDSLRLAANSLGKKEGHICSVCRGRRKRAYGYVWKYKDKL